MKKRVFSMLLVLCLCAALLPTAALADGSAQQEYDLANGSITVSVDADGKQYVTQVGGKQNELQTTETVIKQTDSSTATSNTITVTTTGDAVAEFTLREVNIESDGDAVDIGDSNAEITLEGDNELYSESGSAIHVSGGNATITGSGSLEAEIGDDNDDDNENAKIGSHESEDMSGSIHITGGATVTMEETEGVMGDGAAIGSGRNGDMSGNILIDGNTNVSAFSQDDGAGIGSGKKGDMSGSIAVEENAQVTAVSDGDGAGIGSGEDRDMSGSVAVEENAQVTAVSDGDGAGIGSGEDGDMSGSVVVADNAQVTAWSESEGAGIGTGADGELSGSIIIGGHTQVAAGSDLDGAGIGTGGDGDGNVTETGRIIICDFASVTAVGYNYGSGIGAGRSANMNGVIIVQDNVNVTAIAGDCAAAIGSDDSDDMTGSIIIIGNAAVSTGILPNNEEDIVYFDYVYFDYDTKEIKYTPDTASVGVIGDGYESNHTSSYGHYVLGQNVTINGIQGSDTEALKDYVNMRLDSDGEPENLTTLDYVINNNEITVTATGDGKILQILYGGDETPPTEPGTYTVTVVIQIGEESEESLEVEICDLVIPEPESKPETADDTQGEPLYRVTDKNDNDISYKAEQKDGVLTITVNEKFAILTGKLWGINTLRAQGVEKIVFVTKNGTSIFTLTKLLEKGSRGEEYKLTHDGKAVTFTFGARDIDVSDLLEKE